jgi:hypothetical protein
MSPASSRASMRSAPRHRGLGAPSTVSSAAPRMFSRRTREAPAIHARDVIEGGPTRNTTTRSPREVGGLRPPRRFHEVTTELLVAQALTPVHATRPLGPTDSCSTANPARLKGGSRPTAEPHPTRALESAAGEFSVVRPRGHSPVARETLAREFARDARDLGKESSDHEVRAVLGQCAGTEAPATLASAAGIQRAVGEVQAREPRARARRRRRRNPPYVDVGAPMTRTAYHRRGLLDLAHVHRRTREHVRCSRACDGPIVGKPLYRPEASRRLGSGRHRSGDRGAIAFPRNPRPVPICRFGSVRGGNPGCEGRRDREGGREKDYREELAKPGRALFPVTCGDTEFPRGNRI